MVKLLLNNKYKADFAEFAVTWVISMGIGEICKGFKIMWIARILSVLPLGIQNLEK